MWDGQKEWSKCKPIFRNVYGDNKISLKIVAYPKFETFTKN